MNSDSSTNNIKISTTKTTTGAKTCVTLVPGLNLKFEKVDKVIYCVVVNPTDDNNRSCRELVVQSTKTLVKEGINTQVATTLGSENMLRTRKKESSETRQCLAEYINDTTVRNMDEALLPLINITIGNEIRVKIDEGFHLDKILGRGKFGTVCRGIVNGNPLAVKRGSIGEYSSTAGALREMLALQKTSKIVENGICPHYCLFSGAVLQRKVRPVRQENILQPAMQPLAIRKRNIIVDPCPHTEEQTKKRKRDTTHDNISELEGEKQQQVKVRRCSQIKSVPAADVGGDKKKKDANARPKGCVDNEFDKFYIFMELADGSLDDWWTLSDGSDESYMKMILQILLALLKMGKECDLVHNDCYPRNILFKKVPAGIVHKYVLGNSFNYEFALDGYMFMLADFGISTSSNFSVKDEKFGHETAPIGDSDVVDEHGNYKIYTIDETINFKFVKHVLYSNLPAYSRDAIALISSLLAKRGQYVRSRKVIFWAQKFLELISKHLSKGPDIFNTVAGLETVIKAMFNPDILALCSMDRNMFSRNILDGAKYNFFV